nr:RidA family protein [Mesorhizobium sp. LNJC384A00]
MYSQVVVATGSKLVFVSGQQPEDIHGKLVGHGDFAVQARLTFGNLGRALAAAGARPEQVCKITIYIVDYKRDEHVPIIEAAQIELFGDHKPANVCGRDSSDVSRLPDRDRCDRGHRPVGQARTRQVAKPIPELAARSPRP